MYNNFYDRMFNPTYVNNNFFKQLQEQQLYEENQSAEITKAVKAMEDLCKAVKNMDSHHQEQAFYLCLEKMANEFNWK